MQDKEECELSTPVTKNRHTNTKWQKALQLAMDFGYPSDDDIKSIGISRATYFNWKKRPEFQQDLMDLCQKTFCSLTTKAVNKLSNLIDSENENIALKASQIVLDKTIEDTTENKIEGSNDLTMTVEYVSPDSIEGVDRGDENGV